MAVKFPNMQGEVLEAIHLMYEDYPDVEADCYLYLESLDGNLDKQRAVSIAGMKALSEMGRCVKCGNLLVSHYATEVHDELEGHPTEPIVEMVCPVCDLGREDERF